MNAVLRAIEAIQLCPCGRPALPHGKFCRQSCVSLAWWHRNRERYIKPAPTACLGCGKPIEDQGKKVRACHDKTCYSRYHRRRDKERAEAQELREESAELWALEHMAKLGQHQFEITGRPVYGAAMAVWDEQDARDKPKRRKNQPQRA